MSLKRRLWGLPLALFASQIAFAQIPTTLGWHALPNTKLRSVCAAEDGFPQVWGAEGCSAITEDWSGGVMDTTRNRLIIWGGGHNGYYGNELYAVNLDTATIERLTDPGLPIASSCTEAIANGTQPNSRHTYDGIEYIPGADKMFVFGGSLGCAVGTFGADTWLFDFKSKQWSRMNPTGPIPWGDAGVMTAYDPHTKLVFLHDRKNLYSYDVSANRYTRLSPTTMLGYHLAATIDPKRKKFVIVGYDSGQAAGRVATYDIGSDSTYELQPVTTSGGANLIRAVYPGLDYDPVNDRIVAWAEEGGGNVVYSLDMDTRQWTATTLPGSPTPIPRTGTHGRWRYSPASGVFVVANDVDDDVYVLRLSQELSKRPNPPQNVTAQ